MGVPDIEIEMLNLESLRHRSIHGILEDRQQAWNQLAGITFEERDLPPHAELLMPEHDPYWDYVRGRHVHEDFPMMVQIENDGVHWTRPHVVVPFTYGNKIVGYTCRFLDNKQPKLFQTANQAMCLAQTYSMPTGPM
jgi:hypothetical protein